MSEPQAMLPRFCEAEGCSNPGVYLVEFEEGRSEWFCESCLEPAEETEGV